MHTVYNRPNVDDMAANAVGLGRQVANHAKTLQLGSNAREVAFVTRCLTRLAERQPFDKADEGGFNAVMGILDRSIASECVGKEEMFQEMGNDEFGPLGETWEREIYSDRGNELIELQKLFREFLNSRDGVLDHLAAHHCLSEIMSS